MRALYARRMSKRDVLAHLVVYVLSVATSVILVKKCPPVPAPADDPAQPTTPPVTAPKDAPPPVNVPAAVASPVEVKSEPAK